MIKSDNINNIEPDIIIIKNEYLIEVKYASFTLLKFLAPKFCEIIDIIAVFIPNIGNSTTCSILVLPHIQQLHIHLKYQCKLEQLPP